MGKDGGLYCSIRRTNRILPRTTFPLPHEYRAFEWEPSGGETTYFQKDLSAFPHMCGEKRRKTRKEKKEARQAYAWRRRGGGKQDMSNTKGDDEQSLLPLSPSSLPLLLFMFGREEGRLLVYVCAAVYQKKGCVHTLHGCCCCFGQFIVCFPVECFHPSQMCGCVAAPFFETAAYGGGGIFFLPITAIQILASDIQVKN